MESQACLIGNRRELQSDPERLDATGELLELMEAYLRSRQQVSITANIPGESPEDVARRVQASGGMVGLRGPTIARVFPKETSERDWFALTVVVSEDVLLPTVEALRRAGASEVSATQVRYVFEHRSWTFERLKRQLHGFEPQIREKTTAWSSS